MKKQDLYKLILSKRKPLKLLALQFTLDEYEADELVESTIFKAVANSDSYKAIDSINGWLYSIMKIRYIEKFRHSVRANRGIALKGTICNDLPHSCILNNSKFQTSDINHLMSKYKIKGFLRLSTYNHNYLKVNAD